MSAVKTSN